MIDLAHLASNQFHGGDIFVSIFLFSNRLKQPLLSLTQPSLSPSIPTLVGTLPLAPRLSSVFTEVLGACWASPSPSWPV